MYEAHSGGRIQLFVDHLGLPRFAHAGPNGEQVVGGAATIARPNAQTTVINQATQRAAIDWNGFSINVGEAVIFNQPSVSSVALGVPGYWAPLVLSRSEAFPYDEMRVVQNRSSLPRGSAHDRQDDV